MQTECLLSTTFAIMMINDDDSLAIKQIFQIGC